MFGWTWETGAWSISFLSTRSSACSAPFVGRWDQRPLQPRVGSNPDLAALPHLPSPPAIPTPVRAHEVARLYVSLQTAQALGMPTLDHRLVELVRRNVVNVAEARNRAVNKDLFAG